MDLQEYKEKGRKRYKKFAKRVASMLEKAIKKHNKPDKKFSLLKIESREKCPKKLGEKIEKLRQEKGQMDDKHIEGEIKDLAGCRIIFYYNDDVKKFIGSDLVRDLFDVENDNTKVHYSSDSYCAIHYIVRLKNNESEEFDGLRCEIQIHTLLNHAYSEISHDITYKPIGTSKHGENNKKDIDDSLRAVMEKYLKPAGYELQKIKNNHQDLLDGINILDSDNLEKIRKASNINEIYEILEKFQKALKYYDHYTNASSLNLIFTILEQSIEKARNVPCESIETPFGNFPGYNFEGTINLVLDILRLVQYLDIAKTFSFLAALYEKTAEINLKEQILRFFNNFSAYKSHIFQNYGFYIQKTLINEIEKFDSEKNLRICDLICNTCKSIFSFTIDDVSVKSQENEEREGSEEISFKEFLLPINNELKQLRQKAIEILFELWDSCEIKKKFSILKVLESVCQTPSNISYGDDLLMVILENSLSLVMFYVKNQGNESYAVLKVMYQHTFFLESLSKNIRDKEQYRDLRNLNQKLLDKIKKLHEEMEKDEGFKCYQQLANTNNNPTNLDEFLVIIEPKNFNLYENVILQAVADSLSKTGHLLEKLAEKMPVQILDLVIRENNLNRYLAYILKGLYKAGANYYHQLVDNCLVTGQNLPQIIESLATFYDEKRFQKAYDQSYLLDNVDALHNAISIIFNNSFSDPKLLFIKTIKKLTSLRYNDWIELMAWHHESYKSLVAQMNDEDVENILENLECIKSSNKNITFYHVEHVLFPIANKFPDKVLLYFKKQIGARIDLPFQFHILKDAFFNNSELVFKRLESWHGERFNHDEVCNLFRLIFPEFTFDLQNLLKKHVNEENTNISFILNILDSYRVSISFDSKKVLHEQYKEIIKVLPEEDSLLENIENSLLGDFEVFVGSDGRKKNLENIKDDLKESWLNDENKGVADFAANLLKKLNDIKIPNEQYRMEEEKYKY